MNIREQVRENGKAIAQQMRTMPKCECGHARIKHGVYCDNSCTVDTCGCYHYQARVGVPEVGGVQ